MKNMKKTVKTLLATMLVVAMLAMTVAAFGDGYPFSVGEGIAAPADGAIMMGTIIGCEAGWGGNAAAGRYAAFDGNPATFYDPSGANNPSYFVGISMSEPHILTQIRILPRSTHLDRFLGAAIWGFDGDEFDPATATLIWESLDQADAPEWQVIPASEFITGANTGFRNFAYFNQFAHGDVSGIELWGNSAAGPAEAAEPTPPTAEVTTPEPTQVVEPTPTVEPTPPATTPVAPATSDVRIIVAIVIFAATAFVTLRMTKAKNRA